MTMRYLGSKTLLLEQIFDLIKEYREGIFCDPFGGIGTVGVYMKKKDFHSNHCLPLRDASLQWRLAGTASAVVGVSKVRCDLIQNMNIEGREELANVR